MGPVWGVEDFLDRVNGMLDIGKLGHGNSSGNDGCEAEGCLVHALSVWFVVHEQHSCLPSVTMPNVPSAPMNSFVVSIPADDFLALCRVLMTFPFGNTTV